MWRCPSWHAKASLWGSSWSRDQEVLSCRVCSLSVCWADGVECWARVNKQHPDKCWRFPGDWVQITGQCSWGYLWICWVCRQTDFGQCQVKGEFWYATVLDFPCTSWSLGSGPQSLATKQKFWAKDLWWQLSCLWFAAASRLTFFSTLLGSPSNGVDAGPAEPGAIGKRKAGHAPMVSTKCPMPACNPQSERRRCKADPAEKCQ